MSRCALLSLVGLEAETDELFNLLGPRLEAEFPNEKFQRFDGIVADWSNLKIGGKRKRQFQPLARLLLRWGLFSEQIQTVLEPAIADGVTLGLARQFGFDVVRWGYRLDPLRNGSSTPLAYRQRGHLGERGLPKPLYVFTAPISDLRGSLDDAAISRPAPASGSVSMPPEWPLEDKVGFIVRLCHEEIVQRDRQSRLTSFLSNHISPTARGAPSASSFYTLQTSKIVFLRRRPQKVLPQCRKAPSFLSIPNSLCIAAACCCI